VSFDSAIVRLDAPQRSTNPVNAVVTQSDWNGALSGASLTGVKTFATDSQLGAVAGAAVAIAWFTTATATPTVAIPK
jgi:hypothetical protein